MDDLLSPYALALAHREAGRYGEARTSLVDWLMAHPNDATAMAHLAHVQILRQQDAHAAELLNLAASIAPADPVVRRNRARLALKGQKLDDAIELAEQALAAGPTDPEGALVYACALTAKGDLLNARMIVERLIAGNPGYAEALLQRAMIRMQGGDLAAAIADATAGLDLKPHLVQGWRLMIVLQSQAGNQEQARAALLQMIYAERAALGWGENMAHYRGAELVAGALERLAPGVAPLDIADAGCGTGLVGALVRRRARELVGIDLSPAMLERARAAGCYDALHSGDLVAFLAERPGAYDAVTSAATLIHFGDLRPAFDAAAIALRPAGLLLFTLFPGDDAEGYAAAPGALGHYGCYAHGRGYVARVAAESGFAVELLEDAEHEHNDGKPTMGLIIGLRRR